jgi:hypothetical protein
MNQVSVPPSLGDLQPRERAFFWAGMATEVDDLEGARAVVALLDRREAA